MRSAHRSERVANDNSSQIQYCLMYSTAFRGFGMIDKWENYFQSYQRYCCCSLARCLNTLCIVYALLLLCTKCYLLPCLFVFANELRFFFFLRHSLDTFRSVGGLYVVCVSYCCVVLFSLSVSHTHWFWFSSVWTSKFRLIGFSANRSVVLIQHTSLWGAYHFFLRSIHTNWTKPKQNKIKNVKNIFWFVCTVMFWFCCCCCWWCE